MTVYTHDDVVRAQEFATRAHEGQTRKYTGEPYINHPIELAATVARFGQHVKNKSDINLIQIVCMLHDTVEDTKVTFADIIKEFGNDVAVLVFWMTDTISNEGGGNRAARKMLESSKVLVAPIKTRIAKLADLMSNTADIAAHDLDFARVYLVECGATLKNIEAAHNQDRKKSDLYDVEEEMINATHDLFRDARALIKKG